jgi:hypothetical protein
VSVIGLEDKRGITATVSSTAAGKMLGLQVLFESKGAKEKRANNRSLPSEFEREALRFNKAGQKWDFYSTDTRWTQVCAAVFSVCVLGVMAWHRKAANTHKRKEM